MGLPIAHTDDDLPPELQNINSNLLDEIYYSKPHLYGNLQPWLQDKGLHTLLRRFILRYQHEILASAIPLCLVTHGEPYFKKIPEKDSTEKNLPLMLFLFGKRLSQYSYSFKENDSKPLEATVIHIAAMRATRATSQDPYSPIQFCYPAPLPVYGNSTYTNKPPKDFISNTVRQLPEKPSGFFNMR